MKPKLIVFWGNNNLTNPLVESIMREYFDFIPYAPDTTYDKLSSVFVLDAYQYNKDKAVIDQLIIDGYKVVFENLHEANLSIKDYADTPNVLKMIASIRNQYTYNVVQVPMYFWYCESKAWTGKTYDYKSLDRTNNFKKKFLLMMNYAKTFRSAIYDKFFDILDQSLHSFVDKGIRLDGDIDRTTMYWDRYIDPNWYNTTQFSVVVETDMDIGPGSIFLTEKTMKPLALKHPYISLSCSNSLALLKQSGFESFENLFDESYDSMRAYPNRIDHVYNQVKSYTLFDNDYDAITKQKIEHNYNWFFNDDEVGRRFKLDIIDPILEFVNEK